MQKIETKEDVATLDTPITAAQADHSYNGYFLHYKIKWLIFYFLNLIYLQE